VLGFLAALAHAARLDIIRLRVVAEIGGVLRLGAGSLGAHFAGSPFASPALLSRLILLLLLRLLRIVRLVRHN